MSRSVVLTPDATVEALRGSGFQHDGSRLTAVFHTADFATGARLVAAIAEVADELNHHPDLTLTYGAVEVRLSSHDAGGVTERDLELAHRIDEAAAAIGADPSRG